MFWLKYFFTNTTSLLSAKTYCVWKFLDIRAYPHKMCEEFTLLFFTETSESNTLPHTTLCNNTELHCTTHKSSGSTVSGVSILTSDICTARIPYSMKCFFFVLFSWIQRKPELKHSVKTHFNIYIRLCSSDQAASKWRAARFQTRKYFDLNINFLTFHRGPTNRTACSSYIYTKNLWLQVVIKV